MQPHRYASYPTATTKAAILSVTSVLTNQRGMPSAASSGKSCVFHMPDSMDATDGPVHQCRVHCLEYGAMAGG